MIIRQYISVGINDHACSYTLDVPFEFFRVIGGIEKISEKRIILKGKKRVCDLFAGCHFNMHN